MTLGWLLAAALAASCSSDKSARLDDGKAKVAKLVAKKYAFEAYPQWAIAHPEQACPASLAELREFVRPDDAQDPWGHPYQLVCGAAAPAPAHGFGVISLGADGKPGGTGDDADLSSWE